MSASARPLVLRIITRLAGGGPPVHTTLLNRNLSRFGFRSLLVFGDCSSTERNMEYLLNKNDSVERIPSLGANPNPFFDIVALFRLWLLMRRHRPAIVHTHTAKAGLLGRIAAYLAGVPCIVHTYHGHVLEGYFNPVSNRILRFIERGLGRLSNALFTVSRQQASELADRFAIAPQSKFHVVPLGLDLTPLLALPLPDFHASRLTIGWLGRFVPIKNLGLFLEVVAAAQQVKLPLDFVIAGDGPERSWLEDEILDRQLTNIQVLPWQDRVELLLKKCHLLMLTSHREGTPLALIQGMAAGRPFLATPAGGTVDLVTGPCQPKGKSWWYDNAVLCSPDPSAILATLQDLLASRKQLESLSASSRDLARREFDEFRLVSDVASLYNQLLVESGTTQKVTS